MPHGNTERICPWCGIRFVTRDARKQYCTRDCSRRGSSRHRRLRRVVRFPASPLLYHIERAARALAGAGDQDQGYGQLARRFSDRYGISWKSAARQMARMRQRTHVSVRMADEWAILLGLHPVLIWPDEWSSCGVAVLEEA